MLDLFNLPTPQGCNIQTFYGGATSGSTVNSKSWVKPRGVSNIYMLLISAGGSGAGGTGGGSGAVTVWYGSALNVPDQLQITTGINSSSTVRTRNPTDVVLLSATAASGSTAGTATTAGVFAASGFYQSIAGQAGSAGAVSASATTFLSGGTPTGNAVTANYGYTQTNGTGFFMMQPMIVGLGGAAGTGRAAIGCGGGDGSFGGPGMVLIASW